MSAGRHPMQENAWNDIKEVEKAAGWDACDDCGEPVSLLKEVKLSEGRQRYHCTSCMQRYNVRWHRYTNFGSF
ncbi:hypothetical protein [Massilia sp. TN1-12]|uniref:hypothetical protein n=1 Tax=Massilia paldalensis TaxID=3377675 RepID=UPI0038511682